MSSSQLNQDGIQQIVNTLIASSTADHSGLYAPAQHLLTTILVLMTAWLGVKALIEGKPFPELFADFFVIVLTWGIAAFALQEYHTIISGLNDSFDYIVAQITNSTGASQGYSAATSFMFQIFDNIENLLKALQNDLQVISNQASAFAITKAIAMALIFLLKAAVFTVIIVLWFIAAALYFVVYMMSILLFTVGALLGPIFIPWLLFPPAVNYFNKWLDFMLNAGMLKVVAFTIGATMSPVSTMLLNITQTPPTPDLSSAPTMTDYAGLTFEQALVSIALTFLMAYMIWQAPNITSAMMPGGLGAHMPSLKNARIGGGGGGKSSGDKGSGGNQLSSSGQTAALDRMSGSKQGLTTLKAMAKDASSKRQAQS